MERLYRAYRRDGPAGVQSKKRGGPGNNRYPDVVREMALELVRRHYADFGPTPLAKRLGGHRKPVGSSTSFSWANGLRAVPVPDPRQR